MKEIDLKKAYNAQEVEDSIYRKWEESGFFNPDNLEGRDKDYFSIVLPPPNVTGTLHMGHAAMLAIEDIMVRYNRMQGKKTWWIPGTDHAAIATQTKVEKLLLEKSGKTRHDLGREKFLEEVGKFVEQSKDTIHNQIRKMGSSLDWDNEAYTLDEVRSKAVRMVFKKMYDDGLIYRGDRIVNWCPRCHSTLADDEVEYKETKAKVYTFKYDKNFPISIATTRPETKLGDTAVAVNPKDKRYKKYIGKSYKVNFCGIDLDIKIIGDREVDMEYGTGALGVTPAHSQTDFEMAEKNNLEIKKIIDEDGKMINVGEFSGLTTAEAREKVIEKLKEQNLLEKVEEADQNISLCYRCGSVIEPLTSLQWFIDVNKKVKIKGNKYFSKGSSLKEVSLKVVRDGEIKIIPDRFNKTYFHWMENLRDWCISRQIWFGHQIPVWHHETCPNVDVDRVNNRIEERWRNRILPIVSIKSLYEYDEVECPYCHLKYKKEDNIEKHFSQDPDTLDTWFSSGLWTFSTMLEKNDFEKYESLEEWIKNSKKLKQYHPTTVLETGYDILFFWVARMILMTTYVMGEIPFKNVYLHGLIRDEKGAKMSKSLGNVIDPLDMTEKYGADATRLSLVIGSTPGNDVKLSEEKIAGYRNFVNKLWNISRFMLMNIDNPEKDIKPKSETLFDEYILRLLNANIKLLSGIDTNIEGFQGIENYNFSMAGEHLRNFTWNELADWYLEVSKVEGDKSEIFNYLLNTILKLWHPFMPFVTEAIWEKIYGRDSVLMVEEWPKENIFVGKYFEQKDIFSQVDIIKGVITGIRNARTENKIEPAKKIKAIIYAGKNLKLVNENLEVIKSLARLSEVELEKSGEKLEKSAAVVIEGIEVYLPLEGLVNLDKEKERLSKKVDSLSKYIKGLESKLGNKDFVKNAPSDVVETEKEKLETAKEKLEKLQDQLSNLE